MFFEKNIQTTDNISCINTSQSVGIVKFLVFYVFEWNLQLY